MRTVSAIMLGAAITVAVMGNAHAGALEDRQGPGTIVPSISGVQPSDSPRRPVAMPENSAPAQGTPITTVSQTTQMSGTMSMSSPPPPPGS
jgi:hypothetical protein